MKARFLILSAVLLFSFTTVAHAVLPPVFASNPPSVVDALTNAGYPATLQVAANGDPKIAFKDGANSYTMFFLDCVNQVQCTALAYYAHWGTVKNVTSAQINTSWSQAYTTQLVVCLEKDGTLAAGTMIITEPGGMSAALFAANMRSLMKETDNVYTHVIAGK